MYVTYILKFITAKKYIFLQNELVAFTTVELMHQIPWQLVHRRRVLSEQDLLFQNITRMLRCCKGFAFVFVSLSHAWQRSVSNVVQDLKLFVFEPVATARRHKYKGAIWGILTLRICFSKKQEERNKQPCAHTCPSAEISASKRFCVVAARPCSFVALFI